MNPYASSVVTRTAVAIAKLAIAVAATFVRRDCLDLASCFLLAPMCLSCFLRRMRRFMSAYLTDGTFTISSVLLTPELSATLSPGIPADLVEDTRAFSALMLRKASASVSRHAIGDGLFASHRFPRAPRGKPKVVYGAFASILQGDHGGVEYACQAHEGLLQSVGLLREECRIVANRPFQGDTMMQGLVIDDFFVVSKVPRGFRGTTPDVAAVREAIAVYDREKIIGSPSKDLFGEKSARVIGAHINGCDRALDKGICPLGSPSSKRFALAWITLQICSLAFTTDVLHVCLLGGWVSLLTFRRPLMSILNESFRLVDSSAICPSRARECWPCWSLSQCRI